MTNKPRILALIPARGGSKRLPNKNILPLGEKPLLAWTIDAALGSQNVDDVVVSTDSESIAQVALNHGAKVPFMRPERLSGDTTSSMEVILHAIDSLATDGEYYDCLLLLQPTSPLRGVADIEGAIELFIEKQAKGVVSISPCEHPPLWANTLPESGSLEGFLRPEIAGLRSQDLPQYYRFNGAIYLYDIKSLRERQQLFLEPDVYGFPMHQENSVDIDTWMDFQLAQLIVAKG
ncbi:acylneuraminate cytidylyltransferase family protein [Shewanella cyperi]|uniref:acylneuraminate cytidylyltransferase family protein n=1 Tax=Shewanella cyperi TaxID=2814292 RepID=UPI001A94E72F|nr:acylneuraminate cytidylyltransferase family protein [Shewanella cyperi]QSX39727.1 acylneuraminate cytidylyltransferase family protein [Shewanella cyperi]